MQSFIKLMALLADLGAVLLPVLTSVSLVVVGMARVFKHRLSYLFQQEGASLRAIIRNLEPIATDASLSFKIEMQATEAKFTDPVTCQATVEVRNSRRRDDKSFLVEGARLGPFETLVIQIPLEEAKGHEAKESIAVPTGNAVKSYKLTEAGEARSNGVLTRTLVATAMLFTIFFSSYFTLGVLGWGDDRSPTFSAQSTEWLLVLFILPVWGFLIGTYGSALTRR